MINNRKKKKTLWCRAYATGYRFFDGKSFSRDNKQKFQLIMPSRKHGYADPFPFIHNKKHYIFVEIMDKFTERGSIGVCCIENGTKVIEVINEPFHMSYPNVFEWNGNIYMIPETFEAHEIRLYIAEEFPYKWKCEKVLFENLMVVDFSFKMVGDVLYGLAYDIGTEEMGTRFFKLNMKNKTMEELHPQKKCFIDKRPGGNFYFNGSEWLLPVQECCRCYGEYLHLLKVNSFSEGDIDQTELSQIKAKDIRTNRMARYDRVHTYNRVSNFETIDLFLYQFSLKKIWMLIMKKI